MEFDEMKKIWDSQNNEPLYAINTQALHNRILSKRDKGQHITNVSEFLSIVGNIGAGLIVFGVNILGNRSNISLYVVAIWMVGVGLYLLSNRIRRIAGNSKFDRSMRGDLDHAIAIATYQLTLSRIGLWNILPVGLLVAISFWEEGKSVWLVVGMIVFLALASYAARWEHGIYKSRKRELESLQSKLEADEVAR